MKFIKTINWSFINFDEVVKIDHEQDGHSSIYGYFHMKNGEKFDTYDFPNLFNIDDEKQYFFTGECCAIIHEIILKKLLERDAPSLFSVDSYEDKIWDEFIECIRPFKERLSIKISD